ncbi:MAG: hypothetical protein R3181_03310 [Rubricoccaceae bacterium]|nr:hypothetical protein [Rubricoccaceae bacterium]
MPDAPPPDGRRDTPDDTEAASPNAEAEDHAGGFTLDLSSGTTGRPPEGWRRKRKQASPILTKIVDLTAPKPPPEASRPAPAQTPPTEAKSPRGKRPERARGGGRKPGGATLADLLDEETLARLRGEE